MYHTSILVHFFLRHSGRLYQNNLTQFSTQNLEVHPWIWYFSDWHHLKLMTGSSTNSANINLFCWQCWQQLHFLPFLSNLLLTTGIMITARAFRTCLLMIIGCWVHLIDTEKPIVHIHLQFTALVIFFYFHSYYPLHGLENEHCTKMLHHFRTYDKVASLS